MVWLPEGEKKSEDTFSRFYRTPSCDRQTDGRTSCDSTARYVKTTSDVGYIGLEAGM